MFTYIHHILFKQSWFNINKFRYRESHLMGRYDIKALVTFYEMLRQNRVR